MRTGVVRRKEERDHVDRSADAGGPHESSKHQAEANRQLTISHQESYWGGMRQDEVPEHPHHKRVGTLLQESIDPELKTAAQSELGAKYFVLAEYQEQDADGNAESGESLSVPAGISAHASFEYIARSAARLPGSDHRFLHSAQGQMWRR